VILVVLLFARDVTRSAHSAVSFRRSEDRNFAALGNALISEENNFDARLDRLLSSGATLQRPVFAARLDQFGQALAGWSSAADELRSPHVAHDVNDTLATLTDQRVNDYEAVLATIARELTLPWDEPVGSSPNPVASLMTTSEQWNVDRFALAKEPGHVVLDATNDQSARFLAAEGLVRLTHSSTLALVRALDIVAVKVTPASLPAASGVWLLPPVTSVHWGIAVLNEDYVEQPVTVIVSVTPLNGRGARFTTTMHATLGPLGAHAFAPAAVRTAPSEVARVVIRALGAPAVAGGSTTLTYRLDMSPSGVTTNG